MSFQTNLHNLNIKSPDLRMCQEKTITKPNKSTIGSQSPIENNSKQVKA